MSELSEREELAKLLDVHPRSIEDSFWELIEVEKLLSLIRRHKRTSKAVNELQKDKEQLGIALKSTTEICNKLDDEKEALQKDNKLLHGQVESLKSIVETLEADLKKYRKESTSF